MIYLSCPSCEKKLGVDDSKAGKLGQCPGCKARFRIPEGAEAETARVSMETRPMAATRREVSLERAAEAIAPAPPSRPPPQLEAQLDKLELMAPEEHDVELERPRKRKKRRKKTAAEPVNMLYAMLGTAGVLYVLLLLWAFFSPGGSLMMVIIGGALVACGHIWFIWIARKEDPVCYLMIRFVPFYSVYYFFTRIGETFKPFLTGVVGGVFLLTGLAVLVAQGAMQGGFRDDFDDDFDPPPHVQNFRPAERENLAQERENLAQELLKRPDKAEAKAWLAGRRGRAAVGCDPKEAMQLVQALYARGAKQVLVVDIDTTEPDAEYAEFLIVVLPEERRDALFEYARAAFASEEIDTGQRYLVLHEP